MSLYTISDLHLSLSADKPMDVFYGWDNYMNRLEANWKRVVTNDDTVIIPGDISWALKLEDTLEDLKFIDALPGQKILIKGNHDLWWSTMAKIKAFFEENKIKTIQCLFNSCIEVEGVGITGSRGWFFDKPEAEKKVILREAGRLETSLKAAEEKNLKPLVFLHYPPVYEDSKCDEIMDVLKAHNITTVYHGHIHGSGLHRSVTECDGIKFKLVSCDCIDFTPFRIIL
ncbi:MAG: metallophosphoesterase [Clostridia bacterium]|nr:metallophosphoesterase [Clostridia bacterium]